MKRERKPYRLKQRAIKQNLQFIVLSLPVIVLLIMFSYVPMFGSVLAFKQYKVTDGILGSAWMDPWYKNFEFLFKSQTLGRVVRNTLGMNALLIATSVICAVAFALLMFEVKKAWQVKVYQTFAILPTFLSWVAVSYIVYALLEPSKGILNKIIIAFGGQGVQWYADPNLWPTILMIVNIWHDVGVSSIIYYAALMGVDDGLYEAAELDGASKWQKTLYISIPQLIPIITMMTILKIGGIFRSDFGLFYNVPRNVGVLYPATDTMDTFVYRALMESGNIAMSSAASFVQSVVCFITIWVTNTIVKKKDPDNSLF